MKAYLVSEKLQDFERGIDPYAALGLGIKVKFYELMPESPNHKSSEYWESWDKMKKILNDPSCTIEFKEYPKSDTIGDSPLVSITLPESPLNFFMFQTLRQIINSHSPKSLRWKSTQPNKITFYILSL
jgi:hypothetical protein